MLALSYLSSAPILTKKASGTTRVAVLKLKSLTSFSILISRKKVSYGLLTGVVCLGLARLLAHVERAILLGLLAHYSETPRTEGFIELV